MKHEFTLEFWEDDGWYIGKLREIPGVFSQGETLSELEENIADAYHMMFDKKHVFEHQPIQTKEIFLEFA